jgi:hypothetical protein
MSLNQAAYLRILDEIKNDLPWLIQVWLKFKNRNEGGTAIEHITIKGLDVSQEPDTVMEPESKETGTRAKRKLTTPSTR